MANKRERCLMTRKVVDWQKIAMYDIFVANENQLSDFFIKKNYFNLYTV